MSHDVIEHDDDTVSHKGGSGGQGRKNRHRPFASVLLVGLCALPALALVMRFLVALDANVLGLVIWAAVVLTGAVLPLTALGIGYKVTGRTPFVIWHVVITLEFFAFWLALTIGLSWENLHRGGAYPLLDVPVLPVWWWAMHILGSLTLASTWLIYRIDALRASAAPKSTGSGTWAELFGKGVKPRMDQIEVTDTAIEVPLDHPGVPISQVRQGIAKIDERPEVLAGGTTIVREGQHGGRSVLTMTTKDPFDPSRWEWWPGPSHPGGTYEDPICTAKYRDGSPQWMSFAKTPEGVTFPKAPEFRAGGPTFLGRQGMTGAGKSGDACLEEAEVLTRRDVVLVHVAPAKLRQNAEWLLDMATLAAEGDRITLLFRALRKLGEHRDTVNLGRDFSSAVAAATGRPWVHIFADEFDIVKQGSNLNWLLSKGRSLGFRFSFTLPRGTAKNLDTDIRGQIGAWKQFGLSQDYDAGMVLSDDTMAAGADPGQWKAGTPGAQYLDGAPGVAKGRYAMPARSFRTREDYADLRAKTLAARATFEPMGFPPDELEVLGEIMEICNPMRYLEPPAGAPIHVDAQVSTPTRPSMEDTLRLSDIEDDEELEAMVTGDDELDALLASLPPLEMPEGIDPREPLVAPDDTVGETLVAPDGKGFAPDAATAVDELNAAIGRLALKGKREVTNKDIADEMRYLMNPPQLSKRLKGLLDPNNPEIVHHPTPGVMMKRVPGKPGAFVLDRL